MLTGDSFFHLSALGAPLPGLNLCGAGRVVCLIDPVGDVYACPFVLHEEFRADNVREHGGFTRLWRESELLLRLREPARGRLRVVRDVRRLPGRVHGREVLTGLPWTGQTGVRAGTGERELARCACGRRGGGRGRASDI